MSSETIGISEIRTQKGKNKRLIFVLVAFSFFIFFTVPGIARYHLADPGYVHNHKANELYDNGKYSEALQEYIQALSFRDNSPRVKYNMANAFVKSGRLKDAIKTFRDLLAKAPKELQPKLFYNTGNALYQAKQYKDAAAYFRKALLADPGDRWAKENYEMSLKKLREQKQKQKEQQNNKKKDKKKKQKQKQEQKQNREKPEQKKERKKKKSPQEQKMQRAKRMLKALREQEEQDRKKNAKRKAARPVEQNVKDW